MKYGLINFLYLFLLYSSPLAAGSNPFNLSDLDRSQFTSKVSGLLRGTSLAIVPIGNYLSRTSSPLKISLKIATVYNYQSTTSNIFIPQFMGAFSITENLLFSGNLTGLKINSEHLHISSYGFVYRTTDWQTSVHVSRLTGLRDFRLLCTDFSISTSREYANLPIFIGIGSNHSRTVFFFTGDYIPRSLNRIQNYILIGTTIPWGTIQINPELQLHRELMMISFNFSGSFE